MALTNAERADLAKLCGETDMALLASIRETWQTRETRKRIRARIEHWLERWLEYQLLAALEADQEA